MGKRKASAPQRADKAKRQTLSWDMKDLRHDIKILPNEDPELLEEQKKAERLLEEIEKKANVLEPENEDSCPYETTQFELDEKLQKLVNSSEFFISVYDQLPAKPRSWSCKLGTFTLTICDNVTPKTLPSVSEFWIYVMENSELPYLVYFEIKQKDADNKDMIVYFEATSDMPHSCFKSLQWKTCQLRNYCMVYDDYHPGSGVIRIILYALEGSLTKLKFPSEGIPPKQNRLTLMELMSHFYGFTIQDLTQYPCNKKHDINAIYEEIRQRHINNLPALKVSVQHPNLKPRLRDYQKKAVVWMLTKEHYQCNHQADVNPETNDNLHMLYEEFQTLDGQTLYYNKYAGYLVQEKPLQCKSSPGGILADEMGLGKTVEVLSCILTHPRRGLPEIEPLPVIDNMESATDQQNLEKNDDELAIQDMLADPDYQMDIPDLNSSLNPVFDDLLNLDGTADLELGPQATATTSSNMDQQSRTNQQSHLSTSKSNHTEPDNGSTYLTNSVPGISTVEDDFSISVHRTEELTYRENAEPRLQTEIVGAHLEEHNYCLAHCDKDVTALQGTAISVSVDLNGSSAIFVSADVPVSTDVPANVTSDVHQYFTCTPDGVDQNTDQTSCSSAELALNNEVVINVSRDAYVNTDILQCTATEAHPDVDIFPSSSDIPPCNSEETVGSLNNTNVADELGGELCDALENVASDVHKTVEPEPKKEPVSETHTNHKRRTKARKNSSCDSKSHNKGNQKSPKKPCRKKSATATESEIQDPATQERESKESDKNFECICGERYIGDNYLSVECHMCGLLQHAKCVNYDLNDPCRGIYLCPHCRVIAPPIPSGATLIIAPRSISHQWVEEIQKHIQKESLKVLVYTGVHKMGFVQPQTLARQDIVILSYETLRKEIDYVDLPHSKSDTGRRFRNPKRFMAIPSPIVAVEWWRICLDEAQMVESVTTKTADMALRLKAVNRWCVTGTPIQKSLEDLYGLFVFLGVEPYWVHFWWTELLYKPFCHGQKEPLYTELVKTLWRTAKKDVLDQICLPTQTEEIHWLTFSPVEEHFYRRQYRECASEAMQKLSGWTNSETKLNSLDRTTLHQLLHPLVRLRQACCHPQAVRGEFLPIRKSTLTMEELLNQLVKKARIECEESHRQLVFAFNGLAALDIIQNNYAEAVDKYRSVLRSAEEHKPEIRTDELQLLHTLHNLHEILLTKPAGVPPTLRDSMLQEQAKEIKKKYIARFEQQVIQAQEAWDPVRKSLTEVTQQFKKGQHWWIELIQWATSINVDLQLVEKVKEDLADNREPDVQSMSLRFRNIKGLQYIVSTHLDELESTHHTLITFLKKLTKEPSVDLINKTVECCLRPADKILKTCPFCEADELFKSYESKLFSFVDKGVLEQVAEDDTHITVSARRQGTWADSECERALKTMLAFGKSWGGQSRFLEYGNLHIKMFDALKKEFKCLRTLWLYLRERVSAMDELDMATTRMRLRLPDELKPDVPQPNVLEPNEVEPQRMKLKSDQIIYRNELRRKLGQLLYLKNLAKAQTDFEGGQNPTLCPVCQRKLGTKWSVLQCGHCYCLECVRILVEQSGFGSNKRSLKCPLCRQRTHHADISYVSTRRKDDNQSNDDIKVKGDLSTKVEGIVHCLLSIRKREPQAKTLVFSTWTDVLDVLSTALYENNISFRSLHVCNKFQKNLDSFKHQNDVQVLLLPVQSGSNGLNLIEATHVILVEPILNLAQELQAIGRVHRIGQTRPTVVHRFLVRGTIEERMHYLLQNMQMPTNISNCEETTLTIGELCSLFSDQSSTHDLSDDADSDDNAGDDETNGNDSVVNRRIRDARLSENLH